MQFFKVERQTNKNKTNKQRGRQRADRGRKRAPVSEGISASELLVGGVRLRCPPVTIVRAVSFVDIVVDIIEFCVSIVVAVSFVVVVVST